MKALAAPLLLSLAACAPAPSPPDPPAARPGASPRAPASLLAATADGGVARVDAATGAVLAATPPAGAPVRDLVWDPHAGAAAFVVGDDEETWSEWRLAPLDDGGTEPWGIASTDGRARLEIAEGGWILLEHGASGPGWRFLPRDGAPAARVGAPEPRSPVTVDDARVCALAWVDDALSVRCAGLGEGGFTAAEEEALAPSLGPRPTARLVSLEPPVAIDVVGGLLAVRDLAAGSLAPASGPAPLARVDDARRLSDGRVAVLATPDAPGAVEAQPARLALVDPVARTVAWLALPQPAVLADTFYRRALVEVEGRLFVALDASVVAVDLDALALDPGFDGAGLRGPISRRPG